MVLESFFDMIFSPILKLPTLWAVIIISLLISIIIILITKFTTNQTLMKGLKDEIKEHQKQIKEHRSSPTKALEIQKRAMDANMKYMMHSLKPTLITFIPIILIFGWMSSTFAYNSILPGQEFKIYAVFDENAAGSATLNTSSGLQITGNKQSEITSGTIGKKEFEKLTSWNLKGEVGSHDFTVSYNGESINHKVLVSDKGKYSSPVKSGGNQIESLQVGYQPKKILNLFGWKLGWLGTYIIFSIAFTMVLRKLLKVY